MGHGSELSSGSAGQDRADSSIQNVPYFHTQILSLFWLWLCVFCLLFAIPLGSDRFGFDWNYWAQFRDQPHPYSFFLSILRVDAQPPGSPSLHSCPFTLRASASITPICMLWHLLHTWDSLLYFFWRIYWHIWSDLSLQVFWFIPLDQELNIWIRELHN